MANKKRIVNKQQARTDLPPLTRTVLAFMAPVAAAVFIGVLTGGFNGGTNLAPVLGALGLASWFVGLAFYGLPGMGLRGGRPLFAGIGFATLGWVTFILWRAIFIPINPEPAESARIFIYLLLFEAFAVQLWLFSLLFRSLADWRGPLTAAAVSGVLFGATAVLLFQNAYTAGLLTLIYYSAWGVFYGIIRLRTGSILGLALIQALQSFTVWTALGPLPPETPATQLQWVYGLSTALLLLFIWRLWPKEESDYRL